MKTLFLKLTSILLCLIFALSLFACDEIKGAGGKGTEESTPSANTPGETTPQDPLATPSQTPSPDGPGYIPTPNDPLSKDEWAQMLASETFENVTFELSVNFGDESGTEKYLLDGDDVAFIDTNTGRVDIPPKDQNIAEQLRNIFINTVMAMLTKYEDFEFDNGSYKNATDTIVYNMTVTDIEATISASNVILSLTDSGKVALISCHMKQEFEIQGAPQKLEFDASFKFSDYGTTVIPEETPPTQSSGTSTSVDNSSPKYESDEKIDINLGDVSEGDKNFSVTVTPGGLQFATDSKLPYPEAEYNPKK